MHHFQSLHNLHPFIISYITMWPPLGYILSGLGVAIDGEPFLFIAAFLAYQGYLNPFIAAIVIYFMTLLGDICFYYLGTYLDKMPKIVQKWAQVIASPFDRQIKNHPGKLFIFSKFAYGIHHALWARAGSLHLDIKQFIKIDSIATALWIIVIGGITYTFGAAFENITRYIGYVEVTLLFGLILFLYAQQKVGVWIAEKLNKD